MAGDPVRRWRPSGVFLPGYPLPAGSNRAVTDVVFQIQLNHPGAAPSGFLTPNGLLYNGNVPANYQDPAPTQPSFSGPWGFFSWSPEDLATARGRCRRLEPLYVGAELYAPLP